MQLKYLYIEEYKNLKNFEWDISEMELSYIICIIGQNGAGKSNLLEAIIHIFNCLNFNETEAPDFDFEIRYTIEVFNTRIIGKKNEKDGYKVFIDDDEVPFEKIKQSSKTWHYPKHQDKLEGILPENIIVYYSGYSKRIKQYFIKVNEEYAKIFRQGKSKSLPPLLLIEPVHFKMILLALFSFDNVVEYIHKDFLLKYFGIEKLESVAIIIKRQTNWTKDKNYNNYFDTKGIIRTFLKTLNEIQKKEREETKDIEQDIPPIKLGSKTNAFSVNKVIYLFNKRESLIEIKNIFGFESDLFKVLNILNHSGYLDDIVLMIKKEGIEKPISFNDFSEGEQQLIAIKGCIELLRGKNNLFLWDEPDTYLNARWQWSLIPELENQIGDKTEDQFVLTTHSPVLLSTNKKGVYEMKEGKISSITGTYGLSVNDTLIKQDISTQLDEVREMYNSYISLIQQGKGIDEEALNLRNRLEDKWGVNHPDLITANLYLKYYK